VLTGTSNLFLLYFCLGLPPPKTPSEKPYDWTRMIRLVVHVQIVFVVLVAAYYLYRYFIG